MLSTNLSGILFASLADPATAQGDTINQWIRDQQLTQTLSLITEAIFSSRGVVTKSLKDGLIGTFPSAESALQAVIKINLILGDAEETTGAGSFWRLGVHYAKLHVIAGSVAGEGLDTAITLANSADNSQTLVSEAMADQIRDGLIPGQVKLQPHPEIIKGQSPIYELLVTDENEDEDEDDIPTSPLPIVTNPEIVPQQPVSSPTINPVNQPTETQPSDRELSAVGHTEALTLIIDSRQYALSEQSNQLTVGRGKENNVRIRGTHVSRGHGHFEFRQGRGYYIDHSANGSCLLLGELQTLVHNEELLLKGAGQICLAPSRDKSPDHLIEFIANY
ncbi:MAG: hypothetical protein KUG52_01205 [Immundisolibacteraceae bacterium]|nr:hypothetical protein [Immundisolibacteraceae bacterium]